MRNALLSEQWYVDGLDGLKGPFSTSDIVTKLIAGELAVTDRVSRQPKNLASWIAICNEHYFDQAIKEMISVYVSNNGGAQTGPDAKPKASEELSGFQNLTNIRIGISKQLQEAKAMEEVGAKASSLRQLQAQIQSKRKIVIEVRDEVKKDLTAAESIQIVRIPNQPRASYLETHQKKDLYRKIGIYGGMALITCFVLVKAITSSFDSEDDIKAAEILQQVEQISPTPPSLDIRGQGAQNKANAFRSNFNQVVQALSNNEIQKAIGFLDLAWKSVEKDHLGPLMLISLETAWKADLEEQKSSGHREFPRVFAFQKKLRMHEAAAPAFTEELMVSKIVMASLLRQEDLFATLVAQWLDLEPLTLPVKPFISGLDERRTRWSHLYFWCLDAYKQNAKNAFANAFFANCLTKSKSANEALPYISYAFKVAPQQPQIKGLMIHLLYSTGNTEAVKKVMMGRSPANAKPSRLMRKTLMAICLKDGNAHFCK